MFTLRNPGSVLFAAQIGIVYAEQVGRGQERLPFFSLAIETANLAMADHRRLLAALDSLAAQDPSPETAREVLLLDSGEAPAGMLQRIRDRYPWISIKSVAASSDYGDQKSLSTSLVAGSASLPRSEVLLFAVADCIYEPGWLASFLLAFAARPDIEAMAGETTIDITGPFSLAMALVYVFPRFSYGKEPAPARGFYANNAAFRLAVFDKCPFPSGLSVFRVQNVMFRRALYNAGVCLWRQPRARAHHATPEGIHAALPRYFRMGRDSVRLARLHPAPPLSWIARRQLIIEIDPPHGHSPEINRLGCGGCVAAQCRGPPQSL